MRDVQNTMCRDLPTIRARVPVNPANLAPADCERLGLAEGDWVTIASEEGSIAARVNELISLERHIEAVNVMPRMTGVR